MRFVGVGGMRGSSSQRGKIRKKQTKREKITAKIFERRKLLGLITIGVSITLLGAILYTKRLNDPTHTIDTVTINPDSKAFYTDNELFGELDDFFLGRNFRVFSLTQQPLLDDKVLNKFPLVSGLEVAQLEEEKSTVYITIQYHQPKLHFTNKENIRLAYDNKTYQASDLEGILNETTQIHLPNYTNDYTDLEGIFFTIYSNTLEEIIANIQEILGDNITKIIYLPGGEKLHIERKSKSLYFHIDKDIDSQLGKLLDIDEFYNDYSEISVIDLGSSDDVIVR